MSEPVRSGSGDRPAPAPLPARRPDAGDGLLVVDKPAGWTSHDVVARVRRLAGTRRVGHAGTLDPMATGVLVIGFGRATRLLTHLVGADKEYLATIRLGVSTVTDDAEGEPLERRDADGVGPEEVSRALGPLTGAIQQVPSLVSAIKVDGRRAYSRVRSGEEVTLAARPVTVSRFEVLGAPRREVDAGLPVLDVDVRVVCSSGTYVRALARDLGGALGVGGHLTALRRVRVGPYPVSEARTLEELAESWQPLSPAAAARAAFPVRELDAEQTVLLRHGRRLPALGLGDGPVAAVAPDGVLVALLEERDGVARPLLVLAPA